jgi:hypothetical protein
MRLHARFVKMKQFLLKEIFNRIFLIKVSLERNAKSILMNAQQHLVSTEAHAMIT